MFISVFSIEYYSYIFDFIIDILYCSFATVDELPNVPNVNERGLKKITKSF